jgi:hypothetical protein
MNRQTKSRGTTRAFTMFPPHHNCCNYYRCFARAVACIYCKAQQLHEDVRFIESTNELDVEKGATGAKLVIKRSMSDIASSETWRALRSTHCNAASDTSEHLLLNLKDATCIN